MDENRQIPASLKVVGILLILGGIPIIAILMLGHSGPLDFNVFGQKVGHSSKEHDLAIAFILFLLSFWQYRVLTRGDVRVPFGVETG